jgi:hypothetical protein
VAPPWSYKRVGGDDDNGVEESKVGSLEAAQKLYAEVEEREEQKMGACVPCVLVDVLSCCVVVRGWLGG